MPYNGALPMAPGDMGPDERQDYYDGLPAPGSAPGSTPAPPRAALDVGPNDTTVAPDDNAPKSPNALTYLQALKEQRAAQAQAHRDAFNPDKVQPIEGAQALGVPAPPPKTSALGDFARQSWIATAQMGQGALSAASAVTRQLSADPDMVGYLEEQRAKLADYITGQADKLSPAAREAMHASLFGGKDGQGQDLPSPSEVGWSHYLGAAAASMVPQAAMAVLPGGLVGRVVGKMMGATAGAVAGTGTTAAAFGTQSAGDAYESFTDAIDKAAPGELMKSPVYAELRNQGIDDIEARRQLVRSIAPGFVAAHFGVGAAAGVGLGQFLGGGALGAAGRSVMARAGIGAAEGAATMGGQAGAENALDQAAKQKAGVQANYDPSETARAFASGALGGAVLGAGGGMLHAGTYDQRAARGRDQPIPHMPDEPMGADQVAAMHEAMAPLEAPVEDAQGAQGAQPAPAAAEPAPAPAPLPEAAQQAPAPAPAPVEASAPAPAPAPTTVVQPPPPVPQTTAEPAQDIAAQVRALADPANPKNAVFVAKGMPMPEVPQDAGVKVVRRKEGVLLTTDPDKAKAFRTGPLDDNKVAALLDMGQTKQEVTEAAAKGELPQVIQAKDQQGAVVGEAAASPAGAVLEAERLRAHAPGGTVEVHTPEEVQARRNEAAQEQAQVPTEPEMPAASAAPVAETTPVVEPPAKPKSARQLQKEKMAASQGRMKGEVATGEAPEAASKPPAKPIEQVQEEARAAVDRALSQAKIVPIKEGQSGPALTQARREIEKIIAGARSEDELHNAIGEWGTSSEGKLGEPLPFSKTRRRPVADALMRLLTGEPLKSEIARGVMREDAVRRGADAVGAKETEATRAEGDENAQREVMVEQGVKDATPDHEPSQGVQSYGDGVEKSRAEASNKSRLAGDLLQKVLDGLATPHEAAARYGAKQAGTAGRDRTHKDFRAFLEHEIAHAESPENEGKILRQIAETQNNKTLARAQKAARTAKLQVELERTGAGRASQLREIVDRLDDPVGTSAPSGIPKGGEAPHAYQRPDPAGIAPQASRYIRMANDPRVNRPVREMLALNAERGQHTSSHDILRTIANSSIIRTELRPLRELAARLLTRSPDVPVLTHEQAIERGTAPEADIMDAHGVYMPADYARHFSDFGEHIILNADPSAPHVESALHEILHATTAHHLEQSILSGGRDAEVMRAILDEMDRARSGTSMQGLDQHMVDYATMRWAEPGQEDIQTLHEAHTALMSNPSVQAWAARMTPSDQFRARMAELGYAAPKSSSLWRVFGDWVRRTLGLPPATSASEHTLLDHILRPLQDIVDRGAAHNQRAYERAMPDPVVQGYARPAFAATGGRLANFTDTLRERADVASVPDKAMRMALPWATTDAIHDWNARLFEPSDHIVTQGNPLTRLRDAMSSVASATKDVYDRYADRANALVPRLRDPALGPLMNDATILGARLGDTDRFGQPVDNSHLKTPEQQASLRELQARFSKLNETSQNAYRAARDTYEEWHRTEREARLGAMVKLALPDATTAQQDAVAKALRTKKSTDAFLKSGESDPLAAEFGAAWDEHRELVRGIAKVHGLGFVRGDYFPLRRHGDYVVRYGDPSDPEHYGVEMFERRGEAEARRAELAKQNGGQGVEQLSQVLSKRQSKLKDVLPSSLFSDRIFDKVKANPDLAGHAEELRNLLTSTMLEYTSRSEASRLSLARKGVKGASTDAARVFAQEYVGHGARMGHILHDPERNESLRQMNLVADDLGMHGGAGDQIRARAVINELERRLTTGDDAQSLMSGVARKASTLGFVQSLMSPSHMITSSIEAHMNSSSLLGARHGVVKAGLALSKALMDVSPRLLAKGAQNTFKAGFHGLKMADWNLSHVARDRLVSAGASKSAMHALFKALDGAGLIDHSMEREMRRIANPGGLATTGVDTAWQRFMDLNAAGAHAVDVANKSAIAKAAFDLELRKTGDQAKAVAHAVDTVRRVMPNYNLYNKARMTTAAGPLGAFAAPIMQFKQYGIHMYGVMANLTRESVRGATPEAKREARKALAGVLATHAVMAGALTLIADPLRYLGGAYDYATGASAPHDYQNDVRGFLSDTFGPEMGELISRGLPHALGIDIHRRVGLANLLELPELNSFDKKGVQDMIATAMAGAAGQDASEMVAGMSKLAHGDIFDGLQSLVPRVIRDPMKAAKLSDQGVTDARGKTVLAPSKLSTGDVAAQAVGFQPARVSEFREGRQAVREVMQEAKGQRDRLTQAWLNANPTDRGAVMSQIREFNMTHPQETITMANLVRGLQQRQQAQPGQFGLRIPPRSAREVSQAGRFANVQ